MAKQGFRDFLLADKRFYANEQVGLILGGDIYAQILIDGIKKIVQETLLTQDIWLTQLHQETGFPRNTLLGPSLKIACSQFFRIETRLTKDPLRQREYHRVLAEFENLGQMQRISKHFPGDERDSYFLPHHADRKEESTSTKVRVVFSASCPT